jgi:microcystin degradation protein MlrC/pimeloyl-ACP methyl ester carboxylesterase
MKFFTAFLATETNTFASAPTGRGSFEEYGIFHGDASTRDTQGYGQYPLTLRRWLAEAGHELVESLTAFAMPGGVTVREVYEQLRDEILADLSAAMPVDGVLLILHGAMVADGYADCEGDLLARVREIVGRRVPIGVELDLHCHFTELMRTSADAIVAYKEYPHTDALPRMRELLDIVLATAQGRVRPSTAVFDCRQVGLSHTTREPMAGFVRRMQQVEQQPGVLSVSLGHGFPWADVPEAGAKLWVVTDNDPVLAARLAEQLGREFWALREQTRTPGLAIEEALTQALAIEGGPVVLADVGDNAGGGAMGDSTFMLRALVERSLDDVAIGAFWDLGAVQICRDAGAGARMTLRLGGKCGPASGAPLDLIVVVKAVHENHWQPGLGDDGQRTQLGPSVWLRVDDGRVRNLDIVLTSRRSQVLSPQLFTGLGIALDDKKLIVVKSAQHFHAQFASLAKAVLYVASPGTLDTDFARLPYRIRSLDYWPRVANPHRLGPTMPAPGELHQIDGLQLHLRRSGPPPGPVDDVHAVTIVIESGAGVVSPVYARLQQALGKKYRVCSYDRPGLGWSEPDTEPLDGERNARRLHALLAAAGIDGPLLLIGHSLGGLLNRIYAGLYPEQVAGLVMLDASHPEQFKVLGDSMDRQLDAVIETERAKRLEYRRNGTRQPEFAMVEALFADMPEVVAQMAATYSPDALDTTLLETRGMARVGEQAGAVAGLGRRPLAVLWAPPGKPTGNAGIDAVQLQWPAYQRSHAALSSRGHEREVHGSEHMSLPVLAPFVALIVEEVDSLMGQILADHEAD